MCPARMDVRLSPFLSLVCSRCQALLCGGQVVYSGDNVELQKQRRKARNARDSTWGRLCRCPAPLSLLRLHKSRILLLCFLVHMMQRS
jgi:hypothetical protein